MKNSVSVVRVPKTGSASIRRRVNNLVEYISRALIDPLHDTTIVAAKMAGLCDRFAVHTRREIVSEIRARASALRKSDVHDDLVAAAELDDLVHDLLGDEDDAPDSIPADSEVEK